ncbi:MAG: spermatogenesis associated protein 5 [Marteilia pararefringens]
MRSVTIQVPTVTFADIGGYQQVKQQIMQAIDWPQKYGESLKNLGLETPKGIILYGPPGCCKTMLAKAVANETSTNFLSINASELMSKYVGESEKSIRRYFLRARAAAPAIIFFDEFDSIASKRSSGEENAKYQDSIIGTLLTEIDGIEPLNNVVIIAATNRIDKIDEALLRPGRFDRKILVDRPNCDDRHEIIEILCKKYKIDMSKSKLNAKDFEGLSGAEIVNAFKEAGLRSFAENMHTDCINIDYIAEHVRNLSI